MSTGTKVKVFSGNTKTGLYEYGVICEIREYLDGNLAHYGVMFNDGRVWFLHPHLVYEATSA